MNPRAMLCAFLWIIPYLISGFSAPFIFRNAPTPQVGGHYAGALFIFAGLWSIFLSMRHTFPQPVKIFFVSVLLLQLIFWGWRFSNSLPLKESILLGISGGVWHGIMTSLYLVVALTLLISELRFQIQEI
jgi:hypothetical protein